MTIQWYTGECYICQEWDFHRRGQSEYLTETNCFLDVMKAEGDQIDNRAFSLVEWIAEFMKKKY